MGAGPAGTSGGGDEAQEDEDMADLFDFLGGGRAVQSGSPNL